MNKLKIAIPFFLLFLLFGILCYELFYAKPNELPSTLIGEHVPEFKLPDLFHPEQTLTQEKLRGRVTLLNVWATWCEACMIEHAMLLKIAGAYHLPVYGIIYKDNKQDAINWLKKNGNPYLMVGDDSKGDVAIDLGVYGTPETFVIDPDGKVLYRQIGIIDQNTWDNVLYPIIKKYEEPRT